MGTKQSAEFRQEAVRVALTSGLTRKQVAADFGIGFFNIEPMASARSDDFARTFCPIGFEKRSSHAAQGKPAAS